MFGPGIAPKEILSRLFNPFNFEDIRLVLEKCPPQGSGYKKLREKIYF